jgi:hypothetical protein
MGKGAFRRYHLAVFKVGEFDDGDRKDFFLIYVMSAGTGEDRGIFVFPIKVFCELIAKAIDRKSKKHGTKKVMYISRSGADKSRWFLRVTPCRMLTLTEENPFEVSKYR